MAAHDLVNRIHRTDILHKVITVGVVIIHIIIGIIVAVIVAGIREGVEVSQVT